MRKAGVNARGFYDSLKFKLYGGIKQWIEGFYSISSRRAEVLCFLRALFF